MSSRLRVAPALKALRNCVVTSLVSSGRPVCHLPVIWGDSPLPAQRCDCSCDDGGQGEGWVRLVRADQAPMEARGSGRRTPLPASGCGTWLWDTIVEVGVWRCALTLDDNGQPPSDIEYDQNTREMLLDSSAITQAWGCCTWLRDREISTVLESVQPIGPSGGCVGVIGTGRLRVEGCDPCA